MIATVDIEEIQTVTPITGMPAVVGVPVANGAQPGAPTPFKLSKKGGGAGGFMIPKANAYIGPEAPKNNIHGKPNINKNKVKLLKVRSK